MLLAINAVYLFLKVLIFSFEDEVCSVYLGSINEVVSVIFYFEG